MDNSVVREIFARYMRDQISIDEAAREVTKLLPIGDDEIVSVMVGSRTSADPISEEKALKLLHRITQLITEHYVKHGKIA